MALVRAAAAPLGARGDPLEERGAARACGKSAGERARLLEEERSGRGECLRRGVLFGGRGHGGGPAASQTRRERDCALVHQRLERAAPPQPLGSVSAGDVRSRGSSQKREPPRAALGGGRKTRREVGPADLRRRRALREADERTPAAQLRPPSARREPLHVDGGGGGEQLSYDLLSRCGRRTTGAANRVLEPSELFEHLLAVVNAALDEAGRLGERR